MPADDVERHAVLARAREVAAADAVRPPPAVLGRQDHLVPPTATPADPVVPDPAADYARAGAQSVADADERAVISMQLGRPARGRSAVVHRCVWGLPTVIRVDPRLPDGTPFPTVFWQTCPALRAQIGRLEADQSMVGINQRLAGTSDRDRDFAMDHATAQERYRAFRDTLGEPLPGHPYAGGSPDWVKCLHTHAGHALATNDSPVGEWTVEAARPVPCAGPCVTPDDLADSRIVSDLRAMEERADGDD